MYPNAPANNGFAGPVVPAAPIAPAPAPVLPQNISIAPQPQPGMVPQPQFNQPGVIPGQPQYTMPQPGQQFNIAPQFQPMSAPTLPLVAPNPNTPAPQPQFQQPTNPQPQASPYEPVYQYLARTTGRSPETFRQHIQDNPQIMGQMLTEAMDALQTRNRQPSAQVPAPQPGQAVQPQGQQPGQQLSQKIAIPDAVMGYLKLNQQSGLYEAADPSMSQWAAAANHNQLLAKSVAQKFLNDPTSLLAEPQFQQSINQMVQQQVQQQSRLQEISRLRTDMRTKYGKEIAVFDQQGNMMVNPMDLQKRPEEQRPMLTPLGSLFDMWTKRLANQGMQESQDLYETAMFMAKKDMGIPLQTAQQQGQNPSMPQTTADGNQQYSIPNQLWNQGQQNMPQAQVPGMPPMQQAVPTPSFSEIIQQQTNANTYWPGGAPPRNNIVPANVTIEGAMQMALQNAPDNLTMSDYFKYLGSNLFN